MAARPVMSQDGKIEGEASCVEEAFVSTFNVICNMKRRQNLGNIQDVTSKLLEVGVLQVLEVTSLKFLCLKERKELHE